MNIQSPVPNADASRAAANAAVATEFQNLHEIIAKARANLNQNEWDYIVGGTETETTLRRNRMALDSVAFRPRVLRDVSKVDASVEILGKKLRLPVVLCPVGSLESFHPGGAEPVVKAADEFGVGHMLSSVCDPGLEAVAKAAPGALRMFQLYVRGDAAWADDHVARAIANGYSAGASAISPSATSPAVAAAPPAANSRWRSIGKPSSASRANSRSRSVSRASARPRTPKSRSIMASRSSTSPITAAASSITAAARPTYCRKSSRRWPAAP
jgi:hypothetical protein